MKKREITTGFTEMKIIREYSEKLHGKKLYDIAKKSNFQKDAIYQN